MLNKKQLVALHLAIFKSKKKLTEADLLLIENIAPGESAPEEALLQVIKKIKNRKNYPKDEVIKLLMAAAQQIELAEKNSVAIVTYFDAVYPQRIKLLKDNQAAPLPLILFVKGNVLALNTDKAIAVIGARDATRNAVAMSHNFAEKLAEDGTCIVSGLAVGCDTAAHLGALKSGVGKTIAVLGHGLQMTFPPTNDGLAKSIIDADGCLISIYPFGTKLSTEQFRARNAMQVVLSDATVVIQAENESCGTMVTAGHSIKQGVPLFCVDPGLDQTGAYAGNAKLLRETNAHRVNPYDVTSFTHTLIALRNAATKPTLAPRQVTLHMLYDRKRQAEPKTPTYSHAAPDVASVDLGGGVIKKLKRG